MAKIVLGIATPHSPMLATPPEEWPAVMERDKLNEGSLWASDGKPHSYAEVLTMAPPGLEKEITPEVEKQHAQANDRSLDKLSELLLAANPDVVVVVGDDQAELLLEGNQPSILVYRGETVQNVPPDPSVVNSNWILRSRPRGFTFEETKQLPGKADLGYHIIQWANDRGFDLASSTKLPEGQGISHAFTFVQKTLLKGKPVPTVPILMNCFFAPNQPTPKRCIELGKMLKDAIESWDSDARVAIVASGGLSHFVVDEDLDRGFLKAIEEKDFNHMTSIPLNLLESGNSELRNWMAVAAAVNHMKVHVMEYIPCYRSPAGTGCGMGYAWWD
ncbi:MAG: hypothetical protein V3S02_00655 [Dehalococcoidales bacterium]